MSARTQGLRLVSFTMVLLVLGLAAIANAETITVCWDGSGDYETIQAGIDAALDGDEVVVCDGTYTGPGNKNLDFGGKAITVRSENGSAACSIDCQGMGRAFVFQSQETDASVVSGFTIENGAAPSPGLGGGIVCQDASSPTIADCLVRDCTSGIYNGGGIFCGPGSATVIRHCRFSNNTSGGGAIFCDQSEPIIEHCVIDDNQCGVGGGLFFSAAGGTVFDCLIASNTATAGLGGGIMLNAGAHPNIFSCTVTGNSAGAGAAVYCNRGSNPVIRDSILFGNTPDEIAVSESDPVVTFSDVRGGWPGEGNINADPLFVSGPVGDYYLSETTAGQPEDSPCLDAGSDTAHNLGLDDRTTRTDQVPDSGIVDMGYHYPIVCLGDLDGDGDTDHSDLGILLADWGCVGSGPEDCPGDLDGDFDTDHSDLGILLADWGCGT